MKPLFPSLNRRNLFGLASAAAFLKEAPGAVAAVVHSRKVEGTVSDVNRRKRTCVLDPGEDDDEGTVTVLVKIPTDAKILLIKDGRTRKTNFRTVIEAGEDGWSAIAKGKLSPNGKRLTAKELKLIFPSY